MDLYKLNGNLWINTNYIYRIGIDIQTKGYCIDFVGGESVFVSPVEVKQLIEHLEKPRA